MKQETVLFSQNVEKHFTQYEDLYKFLLSNKGCRKTDTLKKILSKETSL